MKLIRLIILLIILLSPAGINSLPVKNTNTRIITDGMNRKVKIPVNPERVGCFIGTSYETLFLLGYANKVKFISSFQLTPWAVKLNPELKNVAVLKTYNSPNIEELIKQSIDTVFYWEWPDQVKQMQSAGIAVVCPVLLNRNNRNIDEFINTVKNNIVFYQKIFGIKSKLKIGTYIKYYDRWINKILKITSKINNNQRPKVYYVGGPNIFETHGKKSNTYWYIKIAGGEMVPAIDTTNHVNVSAEKIAALNPDIIMMGRQDSAESIIKNPQLGTIKAVKDSKVFITPQGVFYWDHSSEGILLLIYCVKTFHPDRFKDINLHSEVKNFYSVFYGYNLNDDEIVRILNHQPPAD